MPPPPTLRADNPASLIEGIQWLIWRVYHLDDCLDKTQDDLREATEEMKRLGTWQKDRDEADLKEAVARAERRRWFHYGYIFFENADKHGWKFVAIGGLLVAIFAK